MQTIMRNSLPLSVLFGGLALAMFSTNAFCDPPRQRILMDAGWRFHRGEIPGVAIEGPKGGIKKWRWTAAEAGSMKMADPKLDTSGKEWADVETGGDVFKGRVGFAWYRTILPKREKTSHVLVFENVDDNATVYLNGKKVGTHYGWGEEFDVDLTPAWQEHGPNVLAVLVENTAGAGGIIGAVYFSNQLEDDPSYVPPAPITDRYDDSSWTAVHLPHDYLIDGPFDPNGDANHASLIPTTGWYRKVFKLPAGSKGKSLWIDFDGIYRDSIVWLNGKRLGRHRSGYTSFRYDITDAVDFDGENVLAVHVDPTHFEGWWYEGGGIYRHVWLNVAGRVHAAPWGTFVTAQLPEPAAGVPPAAADVSVSTVVANAGPEAAAVTLVSEIVNQDAKIVAAAASSKQIASGKSETFRQNAAVAKPQLWSIRKPYLYRVVTTLKEAGRVLDSTETPFGIRTIRFKPEKGLFLNGEPVKIQGVCNHQDFAGVGVAVPDTLQAWRVRKMKEMGANAWRMSHNPPNPELLDACDRLGMLVMDENRKLGDSEEVLSQVASMVLRDRNHPCVIMWSMCNEEGRQGTPQGAREFSRMKEVVLKHDTTRPISSAMNGGWLEPMGLANVEDLVGVNYYADKYDAIHRTHPATPMFASETASTLTTRGVYVDDKPRPFVTCYNMTDSSWAPAAERAFIAGSFVWTGFDYKGEPTPYKWPCISSHFGILDSCGFPKDNYYYYQSWWKTDPIVHVMPHWNWQGTEGKEIKVIVFSNCEKVELFLNGQSLGTRPVPRYGHLEWKVLYAAGALEAKGSSQGRQIAADTVHTTGEPAALRLKSDRTILAADAEDLSVVEVDVVDREGRIVPTAGNRVSFALAGAGHIAGVGNGDPSDHDPDKAANRRAFNGKCMVLVGAADQSGPIELRAKADGLVPATLKLKAIDIRRPGHGQGRHDTESRTNK